MNYAHGVCRAEIIRARGIQNVRHEIKGKGSRGRKRKVRGKMSMGKFLKEKI